MAELTYNVSEAAAALGISRSAMYTLLNRADFPVLNIGARRLIPKALLAEWVEAQVSGGQKEAACGAANTTSGKVEKV